MASRSCSAPYAIRTWYLADLPDIRLRGAFGAQTGNDIGHGLDLACGHVVVAEREDFQQRQRFLRLFERGDILQDSLGLAVLFWVMTIASRYTTCRRSIAELSQGSWRARRDSNPRPMASEGELETLR